VALPSCPARIIGFKIAPQVGDVLDVGKASTAGKVDVRSKKSQQTGAEKSTVAVPSENTEGGEEETKKVLNLVVKADALGSLEAILGSLGNIKNDEVSVKVVGKGLGNITADDVKLAETTKAILVSFNVSTTPVSQEMIQDTGIRFEQYKIIYNLLDMVKDELEKLLVPEVITTELGNFKLVQIFRTEKGLMVVGGRVEHGKLTKDAAVRVKRGDQIIGRGKIAQLQSGKQSVKEATGGHECGLQFEGKLKLEVGDILEAYKEEKKDKKLVLS
jgi:translation initiation factor IF-2